MSHRSDPDRTTNPVYIKKHDTSPEPIEGLKSSAFIGKKMPQGEYSGRYDEPIPESIGKQNI